MNETDRELLELAAKAAGHKLEWKLPAEDSPQKLPHIDGWTRWNPLTDDGDALRLAVKCGLHVSPQAVEVWRNGKEIANIFEDGPDQYAATRRAIVSAAAEIGKAMQ